MQVPFLSRRRSTEDRDFVREGVPHTLSIKLTFLGKIYQELLIGGAPFLHIELAGFRRTEFARTWK